MPEGVKWPGQWSKVLEAWIESPKVMLDSGWKLLCELSERMEVHVGRDYRKGMMGARFKSQKGVL